MLEVMAIAREDGWAYVRTNDGICLVRPPYMLGDSLAADEQSIEKAIFRAGFVSVQKRFDDWNSLIAFLNQQVAQSRREQGERIPDVGPDPEELLAFANVERLDSFLDRIEVELVPNRAWEHAERILGAMLRLPKVCGNERLVERTRKILKRIVDERKNEEQVRAPAGREAKMVYNDDHDRLIWESWLDSKYGEKIVRIRAAVTELYEQNQVHYGELPYFTPHGVEHCKGVEKRIHHIIPGDRHTQLSIIEKFYLLSAAWFHDIGMLPKIAESVHRNEWPLDEDEIRRRHHQTSESYIVDNWVELAVDEEDKAILGKLCRFHSRAEDISGCDPTVLVRDRTCRLRLLAAYLRIADSLDIGPSRTPAPPYAVCLAYNIPPDSKLHWIKSRLVSCVNPDPDRQKIYVQFRYPDDNQLSRISDKAAADKVDAVMRLVISDLNDELANVMNVITREGISYYLDVEGTKVQETLDSRMLNDLRELVINSDIEAEPSASKLLEMILVSVANIIGFSLAKAGGPVPFGDTQGMYPPTDVEEKVSRFLDTIEKKLGSTRPGHLGLKHLIQDLRKYCLGIRNDSGSLKSVAENINKLFQKHHQARHAVRKNSELLFERICPAIAGGESVGILLYGYSELVTKAICGLRDCLIRRVYPNVEPSDLYGDKKERELSDQIRIFICEGRPKAQTGYRDQMIYHDGSQYALHLAERGFTNLNIIPDIVVGSLMEQASIDYLLVGANGVSEEWFMHSAGHQAVVALARDQRNKMSSTKPSVILVTSTEKVLTGHGELDSETDDVAQDRYESEGSLFRDLPGSPNRRNIWICRDSRLLKDLKDNGVCFINPREDRIPIGNVDYIISDAGNRAITEDNSKHVIASLFS